MATDIIQQRLFRNYTLQYDNNPYEIITQAIKQLPDCIYVYFTHDGVLYKRRIQQTKLKGIKHKLLFISFNKDRYCLMQAGTKPTKK